MSSLSFLFLLVHATYGAEDSLELLQTRANMKTADPVANDEGTWFPTDCDKLPEFELGTPTQSNLGGAGPDEGAEELVFSDAGLVDGTKVDLVVTAGEHTSAHPEMNGIKKGSVIGRINIQSGKGSSLTFSLRDSNKQAKSVDYLALTFLDIDEGKDGNSRTKVTVPDATDLYVSGNTELTLADDCTGVTSSTKGVGKDNPDDVENMNDLQKSRTATFIVKPGSSWKVNFDVAEPVMKSGRIVMFKIEAVIPCIVDGGARCGGPKPTGPPATCGNACQAFAPTRCAFWGDPHYQRTFNAPHGNNFDLHFFGVVTLAKTKCDSVEIQAVQCPWHGGGAAISSGFAMREGSKVATIIGNTVRNADGLNIREGHPRWYHSKDMCTRAWFKTNGAVGTPGRSYYMDMEIQMQNTDADMAVGNCNGQRRNFPTAAADTLFTSDELRRLCGHCRFACPGALLEQDPVDTAVTAQSMCDQMGIDYATADAKCEAVHASNPDAEGFVHESCIMDYCGSEGDDDIIGFEQETEDDFEKEDQGISLDPEDGQAVQAA